MSGAGGLSFDRCVDLAIEVRTRRQWDGECRAAPSLFGAPGYEAKQARICERVLRNEADRILAGGAP